MTPAWLEAWDLVARSCMYLDGKAWGDYLALLDEDYEYSITNYSPDLRKDMVHLRVNKQEMANLLENIHNHIHLPGTLFRQAALYGVEQKDGALEAISYLTVTHTDLDGASSVFCVGRYHDRIRKGPRGPLLRQREFRMETRDVGPGCHYPI